MGGVVVAIVDDNYWTRAAMTQALEAHEQIHVAVSTDQDTALALEEEVWAGVDLALVDVFDIAAHSEVGTDVYSGITALELMRDRGVPAIAIAPRELTSLLALRLHEAAPACLYYQHEVNDAEKLVSIVLEPDVDRRPARPSEYELAEHGAARARANEAVHVYEQSPLYRVLRPGLKLRGGGIPRSQFDRLRRAIRAVGFTGTERISATSSWLPRWPETRAFLLKLLGRGE